MKKNKYQEIRTIDVEKLWRLCVHYGWYDSKCSDAVPFLELRNHLIEMVDGKNMTTNALVEVSEDILRHTDYFGWVKSGEDPVEVTAGKLLKITSTRIVRKD